MQHCIIAGRQHIDEAPILGGNCKGTSGFGPFWGEIWHPFFPYRGCINSCGYGVISLQNSEFRQVMFPRLLDSYATITILDVKSLLIFVSFSCMRTGGEF